MSLINIGSSDLMDPLTKILHVGNDAEETARILIESVKVTLDSSSTSIQRCKAFEYIEKIKDDYRSALSCGFFLSSMDDAIVKHLGLELIENTIRYHWNDITIENKLQIKDSSMELLGKGTINLSTEHIYIKDKISRLVVEMMKREWPQQWPNLLEELSSVADAGPNQAEIVLMILLRLAEDVEVLENSYNRRRDLYLTLSSNMDFLFNMFINLLEVHYKKYKELEVQQDSNAVLHCRVTQVIYMTLSGFVEWVPMSNILTHQRRLFTSICLLIQDINIRQSAAECFLRIVSRKSEGKQLLFLFDKDVMDAVFAAAATYASQELSESNYLFLKTLFQVLTNLGIQLCLLWNKDRDVQEPLAFGIFLHALLEFMRHPSLTIYSYCNPLMILLLKNNLALKTKAFIEMIPHWIPVAISKLKKIDYPSRTDHEGCKYSALDFDDDSDYLSFFSKVRSHTVQTIRDATIYFPEECLTHAEECFHICLTMSETKCYEHTSDQCPSPLQIEWEFVAVVLDSVVPRLSQCRSYNPPIDRIKKMIEKCLQYEIVNPRIESHLLSCISSLCSFLPSFPEWKDDVVQKLFRSFRYSFEVDIPANKKPDKKMIFLLRNHSCAILVKLCKLIPKELLNSFELISQQIANVPDLVASEMGIFLQAQILLLNELNNFETQQNYLGKLIHPFIEKWLSFWNEFKDYKSFIIFLGLDRNPSNADSDEKLPIQENRAALWKCIIMILYFIRSIRTPKSITVAKEGGFLVSGSGYIKRNPGTIYVLPLLESLFCLSKSLNSLLLPQALALHSNEYSKVHEIPTLEINNILNLISQQKLHPVEEENLEETGLEKMKLYLKNIFEQVGRILGVIGEMMPQEFYSFPHLSEIVIQSILSDLDYLPDYKLKYILKGFYKPFIFSCPQEFYESVCIPVIQRVTLSMLSRLNLRWEYVHKVIQSDSYDEDATDTKEMIDLGVIQLLTRDYIDIIKEMLVYSPKPINNGVEKTNEICLENNMDAMEDVDNKMLPNAQPLDDGLGPLGRLMIRCDAICQSQVLTLCSALSWNDSVSSQKANVCLRLCLGVMLEDYQQLNADVVKHIFISILSGIHEHGNDDHNLLPLLDTSIMIFEKLAHQFPVIKEVLLSLPTVSSNDFKNFETEVAKANQKKTSKTEKIKREAFKKLIKGVISKNLSEAFQKEVFIKDLNPMFQTPRNKQPRLDEGSSSLELCKLFSPNTEM